MKKLYILTFLFILGLLEVGAIEIQSIPHRVVADNRTFVRDANDRRYSIWTDSKTQIPDILNELGLPQEDYDLRTGEIFAVFLNDRIEEDLVQIARNSSIKQYFADYADSGIKYRLRLLSDGHKYSHLTAVIFTPADKPNHLGLRGMIANGLSQKK